MTTQKTTPITGQYGSYLAEFLLEKGFVIATGVQYSVRDFINKTAAAVGLQLRWEGQGVNEVGYWNDKPIIRIDPRYFRPTEVETLLGDPSKAKQKLGSGCQKLRPTRWSMKWWRPIWPKPNSMPCSNGMATTSM